MAAFLLGATAESALDRQFTVALAAATSGPVTDSDSAVRKAIHAAVLEVAAAAIPVAHAIDGPRMAIVSYVRRKKLAGSASFLGAITAAHVPALLSGAFTRFSRVKSRFRAFFAVGH